MPDKKNQKVGVTEVVLRDGHQSLLATRFTLADMLPIAKKLDQVGYWSIESWGGATFDSCIRYLNEDPWERLRALKKAMPNTQQQMLLRGQNLVGYKHYSDDTVSLFIQKAAENGIDVFRIFDALNDFNNIEFSIKQVKENGKHAQGAMAYTTSPVHNLDTWLDYAKKVEDSGADSFAIKDMAGILKPYDAFELVTALKDKLSIPIHMQCHATTGMSTASNLKAIEAGIDNIDTSISSMSMTYGHSATETLVSMFSDREADLGLDINLLGEIADYFRVIREKYSEFEGSLKGVDSTMLIKQVPGGMLSNLESQLKTINQEDKLEKVKDEIAKVREDFGFPPLVTPVSQIIGAQSLLNVTENSKYGSLTSETKKLVLGAYGKLPGKIKEAIIKKASEDPPEQENEMKLDEIAEELKIICSKNDLPDLSENPESLLTYTLFSNTAVNFFKERNF
ncbi:MAG: pyruvate carboxylase subunit B [SAR86 cluster bacterium]|jgi:oxaloacetate decarboxylase alpha subunit|nr:pyruvate carboxylase subunit B [SAR86 cluster bacterium]